MTHHHKQTLVIAARVFLIAVVFAFGISLYASGAATFVGFGFMGGAASGAVQWIDSAEQPHQHASDLVKK